MILGHFFLILNTNFLTIFFDKQKLFSVENNPKYAFLYFVALNRYVIVCKYYEPFIKSAQNLYFFRFKTTDSRWGFWNSYFSYKFNSAIMVDYYPLLVYWLLFWKINLWDTFQKIWTLDDPWTIYSAQLYSFPI